MENEAFYEAAKDGAEISIDFDKRTIRLDGRDFGFEISQMEKELFDHGGIASAFRHFGNRLFEAMTAKSGSRQAKDFTAGARAELQW